MHALVVIPTQVNSMEGTHVKNKKKPLWVSSRRVFPCWKRPFYDNWMNVFKTLESEKIYIDNSYIWPKNTVDLGIWKRLFVWQTPRQTMSPKKKNLNITEDKIAYPSPSRIGRPRRWDYSSLCSNLLVCATRWHLYPYASRTREKSFKFTAHTIYSRWFGRQFSHAFVIVYGRKSAS